MKVTFIAHSGFMVELETCYLIFDYYKGRFPKPAPNKPVFIFASHAHGDHFVFDILRWKMENNVRYILSNDIRLSDKYLMRNGIDPEVKKQIVFVKPEKEYHVNGLEITTLISTDVGVAFVVKVEDCLIYHAGDLNVWNFTDGMTRKEQAEMLLCYEREMEKLSDLYFDVAFVPLDPRLNENMGMGIEYFLKHTDADVVVPMHMWGSKTAVSKLLAEHPEYVGKVRDVSMRGEKFFV
jgi:L-ascorbate metabolism protein UlaG (beta-lactamase superfamily)